MKRRAGAVSGRAAACAEGTTRTLKHSPDLLFVDQNTDKRGQTSRMSPENDVSVDRPRPATALGANGRAIVESEVFVPESAVWWAHESKSDERSVS